MKKPDTKSNAKGRTLTKLDISNALHHEIGLSKSESSHLVTSCIEHISSALMKGEDVKLAKFGTFKLKHKKARYGRNPRTGEEALVSERIVVTYKPALHVLERMNPNLKTKK